MPSKKEILNKELIKIQAESKLKARKKAFNLDKAVAEALERINAHIEELYQIAKETTRIDFELREMTELLDQHVGTKDEVLITGLVRDLALAKESIKNR
jgi:hypothetical protein